MYSYSYTFILNLLEEGVRSSLHRQILNPQHADYGGFVSTSFGIVTGDHTSNALDIARACYVFMAKESRLFGNDELYERITLAIKAQRRLQHANGLIDLVSTNWQSAPDTAFTVQLLAPIAEAMRGQSEKGERRCGVITDSLCEYIETAARGIVNRGFHTPNHRWVVCSALTQAQHLVPGLVASSYIDAILAETVDINADGEYSERSSGVYNAIVNRSLRLMADYLDRPEYLEPVRQNLDLMAHLLHPDGSVVTSTSTRQDRGLYVVPVDCADSFLDMAYRDGKAEWKAVADLLVGRGQFTEFTPWLFHPFVRTPQLREFSLPPAEPPDHFRHVYPASRMWRVRRGLLSATAAADNSALFALKYGEVELKALKVAAPYFAKAQFVADRLEETEGGIRLFHVGQRRPHPGYLLPLGRRVSFDEYGRVRSERKTWELPPLDMQLDITEVTDGFDFHLTGRGGVEELLYQVEFCFKGPGEWETLDQLIGVDAGQTAFLLSGYGTFRCGRHVIRVGPGKHDFRMWHMRGAEPAPDAFRVLLTHKGPLNLNFELRCGDACW